MSRSLCILTSMPAPCIPSSRDDQLSFQQLFVTNTYGGGDVPAGAAAAELHISPDNRFVVVSNRNATGMSSDPIATWKIQDDASLDFVQLQGTGGPFPRQFSINAAGDSVSRDTYIWPICNIVSTSPHLRQLSTQDVKKGRCIIIAEVLQLVMSKVQNLLSSKGQRTEIGRSIRYGR